MNHCHKIGIQTVIVSSSKSFNDDENSKKPEKLVLYASTIGFY